MSKQSPVESNKKPLDIHVKKPESPEREENAEFVYTRDCIVFVIHFVNLIITSGLMLHDAKYFAYWSAFFLSISLAYRIYDFTRVGWQFYLVDFCYMANTLTICYTIFFPMSGTLFKSAFALTMGPLASSIYCYRNTLAFHDTIKITTLLIHSNPPLVLFLIRWHDYSKVFYPASIGTEKLEWAFVFSWYKSITSIWLVWSVVYYLIIFVVFKNYIKRNKLESLFNHSLKGTFGKTVMMFGERWSGVIFMIIHFFDVMILSGFSMVFYYNYWIGLIWIVCLHMLAVHNGAKYYIDFHSSRYQKQFANVEKEE